MDHLEYFWSITDFYYNNPNQYMSFIDILKIRLSRTFAILLTFYNTNKIKQSHDLVVGICRCMNELVTLVIHLAQKSKHIIKMFATHPFPFLSQCMRGHFLKIRVYAMQDVTNCDMVCDILLGDNVDYHSKPGYGKTMTPTTQQPLMSPALSHLFL